MFQLAFLFPERCEIMADMTKLISKIFKEIRKHPKESSYYKDAMSALQIEDVENAHEYSNKLRSLVTKNISKADNHTEMYKVYRNTLLFDAPIDFDSYLLYMEIDREPKERFYQPRRKTLKQLVDALQDLADDKLDELFISQPPRTGKTSLLMFFVTWLLGRNSEVSNLYCAYSDTITRAFYSGVLEVITDPDTYKWREVFPKAEIVQTNAAEEILNIDRRKRYPSLTCRSLYGTLNGACDCNGFLISDDLIGGIEEALNKWQGMVDNQQAGEYSLRYSGSDFLNSNGRQKVKWKDLFLALDAYLDDDAENMWAVPMSLRTVESEAVLNIKDN